MISEQSVFFFFRPGALLRVGGEDAFGFLQGQFTNELRQPENSATYGLWLNQKGKVLADSHVLGVSEKEFLITSVVSSAEVIQRRLEQYIVADDVTLADETAAVHGMCVGGAGSGEVIKQLVGVAPTVNRFIQGNGLTIFRAKLLPGENYEIIGSENAVSKLRAQLAVASVKELSRSEMEFARIAAGIPSVPADLGPTDLPNEGGLENSALSYTKGCYLGQEVMARLKNLGQVRRRLKVVRGHGSLPAAQAPLFQGEKKVGEIRSTARRGEEFVAFAMLSLINLDPAAGLGLQPSGPANIMVDANG